MVLNPQKYSLEGYQNEILAPLELGERVVLVENIRRALGTVIYPEAIQYYLNYAIGQATQGGSSHTEVMARGIDFLARAAVRSERSFAGQKPEGIEDADRAGVTGEERIIFERTGGSNFHDILHLPVFLQHLAQLKQDVSQGVIRLMPFIFRMGPYTGQGQVHFANEEFGRLSPEVQRFLAEANYSAFTGRTMKSGADLLQDPDLGNLVQWSERGVQEGMPHLTLSNMAMGQIFSALLQKLERIKSTTPITLIDMGSGTGATLAALTLGMENATASGFNPEKHPLSVVGIDGTRSFFEQLKRIGVVARQRLEKSGFKFQHGINESAQGVQVERGDFRLMYGDILENLKALQLSPEMKQGVVVLTANYVWHRLPSPIKAAILDHIAKNFPDAYVFIADLRQNCSAVNLGYFNFRDNGLLNCGNVDIEALLRRHGFNITPLNEQTAPRTMSLEFASRIGAGTTSDSFFYIASHGPRAKEWMGKD